VNARYQLPLIDETPVSQSQPEGDFDNEGYTHSHTFNQPPIIPPVVPVLLPQVRKSGARGYYIDSRWIGYYLRAFCSYSCSHICRRFQNFALCDIVCRQWLVPILCTGELRESGYSQTFRFTYIIQDYFFH
jgi:hypothetical protein